MNFGVRQNDSIGKQRSIACLYESVRRLALPRGVKWSIGEYGPMSVIGIDTTQTHVHEPAKLYRVVNEYPKYGCSCCKVQGIVTAERPTSLVEGNRYDTSVAAAIVVQKYDSHLPQYRQTVILD